MLNSKQGGKEHIMCFKTNCYFNKNHPIPIRLVHVEALEGKAGYEGLLEAFEKSSTVTGSSRMGCR